MEPSDRAKRYIRIANQCVDRTDSLNPKADIPKLRTELNPEEVVEFVKMLGRGKNGIIDDSLCSIVFYRSCFYRLAHARRKDPSTGQVKSVTVMLDDRDVVHTIMAEGKVLWTKEM
jgi:hypothetical protein